MKREKKPSSFVNLIFLILSVFCMVYYLMNGVIVRFPQSLLWLWLVMSLAFFLRYIIVRRTIRTGKPSPLPKILLRLMHSAIAIGLVLFISVEALVISAAFSTPPDALDYIIVLGAKVNGTSPSGALRNRITVAYEYLLENPDTLIVASGGQGPDEGISEAECIRRGLTARGIADERIIMEDQSTSTLENILLSLPLMEKEDAKIGVVTNNYHMYRAMKIASSQTDRDFYSVPVATSMLSLPHGMLREFAAILVGFISGDFT